MSQYKVKTVHHPLNCTVEVPGSKSITNRALLMRRFQMGSVRFIACYSAMIQDIF